MNYTITELRDMLINSISHSLFNENDIALNDHGDALIFTYPNLQFCKQTVGSFYLKKEAVECLQLNEYVKNIESYENKASGDFININYNDDFYKTFFSKANELFVLYLQQKEVESFGCCSKFVECSDEKRCLCTGNRDMFLGCLYRQNLYAGKIFYGKNSIYKNEEKPTNELYPTNYCCIDLETTGFSPKNDKIIDIGIVKIRDGNIVDTYNQFIDPEQPIPYFIKNLTGITNEMTNGCPKIYEILNQLKEFIGDDVLVGHNIVSFDVKFLKENFSKYNNETLENKLFDTLSLAQSCLPFCENHKLETLLKYLEIDCSNSHRALVDAKNTYLCYEKIRNLINTNNIPYKNANYCAEFCNKKDIFDFSQKQISFTELAATTSIKKIAKAFSGKSFVFTGDMKKYTRAEACKIVIENGGTVKSGVSKLIDFLVDADSVVTSKETKARELIAQGYLIKIISEAEFLNMINDAQ